MKQKKGGKRVRFQGFKGRKGGEKVGVYASFEGVACDDGRSPDEERNGREQGDCVQKVHMPVAKYKKKFVFQKKRKKDLEKKKKKKKKK